MKIDLVAQTRAPNAEHSGLLANEATACGALPAPLDEGTGRFAAPGDAESLAPAAVPGSARLVASRNTRAERLWNAETMVDHYEALNRKMLVRIARIEAIAA